MFALQEPNRTRFDVHFKLAGFPVRVHWGFWVVAILLGFPRGQIRDYDSVGALVLSFVLAATVSILIHELGHAVLIRHYGWNSRIILYWLGGLATFDPARESYLPSHQDNEDNPKAKILISLAGPGAQFLLLGLLVGILYACNLAFNLGFGFRLGGSLGVLPELGQLRQNLPLSYLVLHLLFINFLWPLVNLLPIFPLDGGQVSRELFSLRNPRAGIEKCLMLSMVIAAVTGVVLFMLLGIEGRGLLPLIFFGMLAVNNYLMLQQLRAMGGGAAGYQGPEDDDDWWKR